LRAPISRVEARRIRHPLPVSPSVSRQSLDRDHLTLDASLASHEDGVTTRASVEALRPSVHVMDIRNLDRSPVFHDQPVVSH
jgi:hypothetical protein